MKERSIADILKGFPKVELEDLGSILGKSLPSRLRKAELVEKLKQYQEAADEYAGAVEYKKGNPDVWEAEVDALKRNVRLARDAAAG